MTYYGSQEKGEEDHQEEGNEKEKEVVLLVLIRIDNAPIIGAFLYS